jgi:class 3 adenylate cyclase/ActR/RegA family two-component response regulator
MTANVEQKKQTILIVDDAPDNLALMGSLLKEFYKTKVALNGDKALQIAMSNEPPDLILLDVMMPGIDGYEVCRRLKENKATNDIPVIFLTAKTEVEDEQKGLELGAVDYVTKPISPPIVLARVKNHLMLQSAKEYLKEKNQFLENAFSRYVSSKVIEQLKETPIDEFLRMDKREVSILFVDMLGFTALGNRLTPEEVQETVNSFLANMVKYVEEMDGMVDKFLGDGLMAIFGAPLRHETHAWQALSAAASMQRVHKGWMESRQAANKPAGAIGIGVATGEVVVGNIGTSNRMEYTALGHLVNLASRLCGAAAGGEILTIKESQEQMKRHASALQVHDEFLTATFISKGFMTFKNIAEPIEVFAVSAV